MQYCLLFNSKCEVLAISPGLLSFVPRSIIFLYILIYSKSMVRKCGYVALRKNNYWQEVTNSHTLSRVDSDQKKKKI